MITDKELNDKEIKSSFLQHPGFKLYKEKLEDFKKFLECEKEKLLGDSVLTEKRYDQINFHLGEIKMLKMVNSIEEEFKEQISSSRDVKKA
jgi:hypothetical protein